MNKIISTLSQFGVETMVDAKPLDSNIEHFESIIGARLPDDYRIVLREFDAFHFTAPVRYRPKETSPRTSDDGSQDIVSFYGFGGRDNLFTTREQYSGRIPKDTIPIADAGGGDLICLQIRPDNGMQRVLFWFHEEESIAGMSTQKKCVYVIADSFKDFVNSFFKDDTRVSKSELSKVKVRTNAAFLNALRKPKS